MKNKWKIFSIIYGVISLSIIIILAVYCLSLAVDLEFDSQNLAFCENKMETISTIVKGRLNKKELVPFIEFKFREAHDYLDDEHNILLINSLVIVFDKNGNLTKIE